MTSSRRVKIYAILLVIGLVSASCCENERAESFQSGYNSGYQEGQSEGYSSGYEVGKTEGYNNGYQQGKSVG